MATDPTEGLCELIVRVSAPGKYAYEIKGDRIGKYNLLGVMQLIQKELVDDVYSGVRRTKQTPANTDKTAQNGAKIDVAPDRDYTDGVSMPKHEALRTYFAHLENMRNRMMAIEASPDDELFIVPTEQLQNL